MLDACIMRYHLMEILGSRFNSDTRISSYSMIMGFRAQEGVLFEEKCVITRGIYEEVSV